MNRILKNNNRYQVLITPSYRFDAGYGLLLGCWSDPNLSGYSVKEYDRFDEALDEATQHPPIDWYKLVLFQKDVFVNLRKIIRNILEQGNFIAEFEPHLMTPEELKTTMIRRVSQLGNRFRLTYNLNDCIGFHIINPWQKNLEELAMILKSIPELRITKILPDEGVIKLIGTTDMGTTYEIVLWTTMMAQYARWVDKNPSASLEKRKYILNQMKKNQRVVEDSGQILR
jgi:hypothetical protein